MHLHRVSQSLVTHLGGPTIMGKMDWILVDPLRVWDGPRTIYVHLGIITSFNGWGGYVFYSRMDTGI